jgi:hypothetical protein
MVKWANMVAAVNIEDPKDYSYVLGIDEDKEAILVIGVCTGADKQGLLTLTIILHKNHQIYVGTWYETCSSAHVSEMVIVPHHGQPGGFHWPARVYLLCSPSAATRGKMGITCALSASNLAKYPKTSWVLVTLQRLAHATPHVRIPHICLHFSAASLQETRLQGHSLLHHYHAYNIGFCILSHIGHGQMWHCPGG